MSIVNHVCVNHGHNTQFNDSCFTISVLATYLLYFKCMMVLKAEIGRFQMEQTIHT